MEIHEPAFAEAAEPCCLAFGKLPGMGFHQFHRCRQILLCPAIIDNLGITDRLPGRLAQPQRIGKEAADLIDQSGGEHGFHAAVDADV